MAAGVPAGTHAIVLATAADAPPVVAPEVVHYWHIAGLVITLEVVQQWSG